MNYSHDNWSAILAHIGKPEELLAHIGKPEELDTSA
ncbi:hypothetical protein, partial [Escherichia coli]